MVYLIIIFIIMIYAFILSDLSGLRANVIKTKSKRVTFIELVTDLPTTN